MKSKLKFATFVVALILTKSVFSATETLCPDIATIKTEKLSMAEEIGPDTYLSYHISTYSTPSTWGFIIAPIEADSNEIALETANEILSTMTAPGIVVQRENTKFCIYDTGHDDIIAAAINDQQISPLRLKHHFRAIH